MVGLYFFIPHISHEEIGEEIGEEFGEQLNNSSVKNNGLIDQHDFINNTIHDKPVLLLIGGYSIRVDNSVEIHEKVLTDIDVVGSDLDQCKGFPDIES